MHLQYGQPTAAAAHTSPRFLSATAENTTSVTIRFHDLPPGALPLRLLAAGEPNPPADPSGLASQCPVRFGVPAAACAGFELQTSDGDWHAATRKW